MNDAQTSGWNRHMREVVDWYMMNSSLGCITIASKAVIESITTEQYSQYLFLEHFFEGFGTQFQSNGSALTKIGLSAGLL